MFKVDQLIIIAGPSRAGKSFLIKKLRRGDCPRLCEQLGIDTPSSWLYVATSKLEHLPQESIERLVVHYDIYRHYSQEKGFNHLHKLIINSSKITILTLYVPQSILIKRDNSKLLKLPILLLISLFRFIARGEKISSIKYKLQRKIIRTWTKRKDYKVGYSEIMYEKWFSYLIQKSITNHWLLDFNKTNSMIAHPYKAD